MASAVELVAADGIVLRGVRWQDGSCWLVLLHERGHDLDRWWPLEPLLAVEGLSALALDRRGHGGSGGTADATSGEGEDVRAAVRFARESDADCVILVAAGDAALVALEAVDRDPPDGLVLLSPTAPAPENLPALRGAGCPKLTLVGRHEADDTAAAALQRVSIGWSLVVSLPAEARGTELITGDFAVHGREQLVRFVAETRWRGAEVATPTVR